MAKRNKDEQLGHIRVRPHCSICNDILIPKERIVALLGNRNSTDCELHTDVASFPDHGHNIQRASGRILCRYPDCKRCATSPEASSMHAECFEIFTRDWTLGKALNLLWIATAWRNPWRGAPDLRLHSKINIALSNLPATEKHCIPQLSLLPPELIRVIQKYSERCILALDLVYRLSAVASNDLVSVPLRGLSTWQRGDWPIAAVAPAGHIIRLTIDCHGIKKIERLSKYPPCTGSRFDNMAFVIQEESHFDDVVAWFTRGLLRLELPEASLGLQIWDTPAPPDLEHCTFCPANITASTRFRTIDMRKTIGITFFFCRGEVYAIHSHTSTMPCAKTTLEHLSCRRRRVVAWVYIPISPRDQVVAFGTQLEQQSEGHFITEQPRFLFRTKLAGDVSIGPYHSGHTRDFILSKAPPATLIYNTADIQPVSTIGAYSKEERICGPITPFSHPTLDEPPFQDACFSSAPLESVTRVKIFYNEENGHCRGILFDYDNGAQQALGQCRLGVDPHRTCVKPS
ncbi:hypothetical protein EG329_003757 [Mollisiaceae sp. DMI_Dod_QoI]|nr:hypothetical protein EG329_003757 [Helotiales sp. DMI_Dod_QoI]